MGLNFAHVPFLPFKAPVEVVFSPICPLLHLLSAWRIKCEDRRMQRPDEVPPCWELQMDNLCF